MGKMVPPAVRPRPAASSSARVVVTMMEAGSPLCCPSFPDANSARSAALAGVLALLLLLLGLCINLVNVALLQKL
jgi:hypothetical protein